MFCSFLFSTFGTIRGLRASCRANWQSWSFRQGFFDGVVRLGWVLNRIYDDSAKELDCGMTKSQNNWIYPNFVVVARNKNVGLERFRVGFNTHKGVKHTTLSSYCG
jgi:hypothetical protein